MAAIIEIKENDKDCLMYHIEKLMKYTYKLEKCLKALQEMIEYDHTELKKEHEIDDTYEEYLRYN